MLFVLCGMGGLALWRWFDASPVSVPPPNPPTPVIQGVAPSENSPMRVTVIETIQNSATVLVYVEGTRRKDETWIKAAADGTSLILISGEHKKTLEFAVPIVISHSEYVNHAQENAPTLVLEILFNADMDTL